MSQLKGQSHKIFLLRFFSQTAHSGPIRDVLGPFSQSYCTFKRTPQYFGNPGVAKSSWARTLFQT